MLTLRLGRTLMQEAVTAGDQAEIAELLCRLAERQTQSPDLLFGALGVLARTIVACRDVGATIQHADVKLNKFLNGTLDRMTFELMDSHDKPDQTLHTLQILAMLDAMKSLHAAGYRSNFSIEVAPAPAPPLQIHVMPAPVTVINDHPTGAVQTVERNPTNNQIVTTKIAYVFEATAEPS